MFSGERNIFRHSLPYPLWSLRFFAKKLDFVTEQSEIYGLIYAKIGLIRFKFYNLLILVWLKYILYYTFSIDNIFSTTFFRTTTRSRENSTKKLNKLLNQFLIWLEKMMIFLNFVSIVFVFCSVDFFSKKWSKICPIGKKI